MESLMLSLVFILIFVAAYVRFIYLTVRALKELEHESFSQVDSSQVAPASGISVIVPFRNERNNLGQTFSDLSKQTYPADRFEVIWVDDHSDDDGAAYLERQVQGTNQRTVTLNEKFGKKAALQLGMDHAQFDCIVFTDADCSREPGWLGVLAEVVERENADLVVAPVLAETNNSSRALDRLLIWESAALALLTLAQVKRGRPAMANGANLLIKKKVFEQLNGYAGNEEYASGDDMFLLEKAVNQGCKIKACGRPEGVVRTTLPSTKQELLLQRVRWLRKTKKIRLLGALELAVLNGSYLLLLLVLTGLLPINWFVAFPSLLVVVLVKVLSDYCALTAVRSRFNRRFSWGSVLYFTVVYPVFQLRVLMASLYVRLDWKGREINA